MIITVIGTQNTGKTTFVRDFLTAFDGWITPDVDYRRLVKEKGLTINRNGNAESQNVIFDHLLDGLLNASKSKDNVIFDRSVIDACAYTAWLKRYRPGASGVDDAVLQRHVDLARKNAHLYDLIVYTPLAECGGVKIEDDGTRDTDQRYRCEIDDIFAQLIEEIGIRGRVTEIYGTREERIERIREILRGGEIRIPGNRG